MSGNDHSAPIVKPCSIVGCPHLVSRTQYAPYTLSSSVSIDVDSVSSCCYTGPGCKGTGQCLFKSTMTCFPSASPERCHQISACVPWLWSHNVGFGPAQSARGCTRTDGAMSGPSATMSAAARDRDLGILRCSFQRARTRTRTRSTRTRSCTSRYSHCILDPGGSQPTSPVPWSEQACHA